MSSVLSCSVKMASTMACTTVTSTSTASKAVVLWWVAQLAPRIDESHVYASGAYYGLPRIRSARQPVSPAGNECLLPNVHCHMHLCADWQSFLAPRCVSEQARLEVAAGGVFWRKNLRRDGPPFASITFFQKGEICARQVAWYFALTSLQRDAEQKALTTLIEVISSQASILYLNCHDRNGFL